MPEIGDTAPAATFVRLDGSTASAADYLGSKLVVYFYPKDDTPGCTNEAKDFTALAAEFAKAGTKIVGISKDSAKRHAKFRDKYELAVELGSDESGAVCEAFGVWVVKSLYGREYLGIERATFLIGSDGRIAHIWRKVKVKGHAQAVLEAAGAL
jgi:thioredoxin-dependent peroxiredoxin